MVPVLLRLPWGQGGPANRVSLQQNRTLKGAHRDPPLDGAPHPHPIPTLYPGTGPHCNPGEHQSRGSPEGPHPAPNQSMGGKALQTPELAWSPCVTTIPWVQWGWDGGHPNAHSFRVRGSKKGCPPQILITPGCFSQVMLLGGTATTATATGFGCGGTQGGHHCPYHHPRGSHGQLGIPRAVQSLVPCPGSCLGVPGRGVVQPLPAGPPGNEMGELGATAWGDIR